MRPHPAQRAIFVFGSNLAGIHGAGAALTAHRDYGAKIGVGSGPTGQSYAIPTKATPDGPPLPLEQIQLLVSAFLWYAAEHPATPFLVTRIGCGLAGYQRGLLRHYHGERFGTDDEHRVWMSLADDADVSRNMRGLGYRAGLAGEWAEPPQDDAEQADRP